MKPWSGAVMRAWVKHLSFAKQTSASAFDFTFRKAEYHHPLLAANGKAARRTPETHPH
jgi:hypothetical protein